MGQTFPTKKCTAGQTAFVNKKNSERKQQKRKVREKQFLKCAFLLSCQRGDVRRLLLAVRASARLCRFRCHGWLVLFAGRRVESVCGQSVNWIQ